MLTNFQVFDNGTGTDLPSAGPLAYHHRRMPRTRCAIVVDSLLSDKVLFTIQTLRFHRVLKLTPFSSMASNGGNFRSVPTQILRCRCKLISSITIVTYYEKQSAVSFALAFQRKLII